MRMKYIFIMLFTLAGLAGMAQTNEPLPGDAEPLTNQLYLSPSDSTVWAADPFSGLAIKVGTWFKVDSLFKEGYTKAQVDSAIMANRQNLQQVTDLDNITSVPLIVGVDKTPGAPGTPAILVNRRLNSSVNTRGFRDNSEFETSNGSAYAAFDAEAKTVGSGAVDHIIGFQSRVNHNSSGVINRLIGFGAALELNGGTVNEVYGFRSGAMIGNSAGVSSYYGLRVDDPTKGASRYGVYLNIAAGVGRYNIYAASTAANYFAGPILSAAPITVANVLGDAKLVIERTANAQVSMQFKNSTTSGFLGMTTTGELRYSNTSANLESTGATVYTSNSPVISTEQYRLSSLNTPPASATDTGTTGEIRFGTDGRIYICTATNTWIRSEPLTTW